MVASFGCSSNGTSEPAPASVDASTPRVVLPGRTVADSSAPGDATIWPIVADSDSPESPNGDATTSPLAHAIVGRFPADSGVIDITKAPYNADFQGLTDDTDAITRAIHDVLDVPNRFGIIYFPAGTYLVSRTLSWQSSSGAWGAYLSFVGEDPSNTTIKLIDGAPSFSNVRDPRAVIKTGSFGGDASGGGNQAFGNYIEHLSVNVGSRNSGAIGIDYLANNDGAVKDVTITTDDGSGAYGLAFTRGTGPSEVVGVSIRGFDYGVYIPASGSQSLEHIRLTNQNRAGIYNPSADKSVFTIRDLQSSQNGTGVPAIQIVCDDNSWTTSLVTVLDSVLTHEASGSNGAAIANDHGRLLLRNVRSEGYDEVLAVGTKAGTRTSVVEITSDKPLSLFGTSTKTLNLPIEETPTVVDGPVGTWANIRDARFAGGAKTSDSHQDSSAAIQAAIDSGAKTVYFPTGNYWVNATIHIRGNVQHILGMDSQLTLPNQTNNQQGVNYFSDAKTPHPLIQFDAGAASLVVVEHLHYLPLGQGEDAGLINFQNDSAGTVVLRDMEIAKRQSFIAYQNGPGAGPLFLEDVYSVGGGQGESQNTGANPWLFTKETVWARQFNPEPGGSFGTDPEIVNSGGKIWIFGAKTESQRHPYLQALGGAQTEMLGAWVFLYKQPPPDAPPLFINEDSDLSVTFQSAANDGITTFPVQIREVHRGVTKDLGSDRVDPQSNNVNLFADSLTLP